MFFLELAMLLVGLFAVFYSFKISEKKGSEETTERVEYVEYSEFPDKEWQEKIEKLKAQAEDVYVEIDEKISQLSNEKIMGMNEYSDQVLDKIEKNHGEVVFLYDMMNEKQEEIKKIVNEVDSLRAGIKNDAEEELQKLLDQEDALDKIKQEIEMEALEIQAKQKEIKESQTKIEESQKELEEKQKEIVVSSSIPSAMPDISDLVTEIPEPVIVPEEVMSSLEEPVTGTVSSGVEKQDEISASDIIDAEIARIEEEEAVEQKESGTSTEYTPLSEQKKPENHNSEIIDLYKKGRSIIEISKMLSLGQGEVKFVIDLYNAR